MDKKMPQLLAPAGDLQKLKTAFLYGADAVYVGGKNFGLRAAAQNFSDDELAEAIAHAHDLKKEVYVTVNIMPRSDELSQLKDYLSALSDLKPDALIICDLGVLSMCKKYAPDISLHISTQASTVNYESACLWHELGASRIILARELNMDEIRTIAANTPKELELEAFVHGAMCMSYSGRCLLSSFLASRDPNRGMCAQSCRWKYALVEEKRPGEYLPISEDENGSYILNSKDLCMIEHIDELLDLGLAAFKIEGRVKSEYYVASTVSAYRRAIDLAADGRLTSEIKKELLLEVQKVSHRPYFTGFYFGDEKENSFNYESSDYIRDYEYVAYVDDFDVQNMMAAATQKNRFFVGDELEALMPGQGAKTFKLEKMIDENKNEIDVCPHPEMKIYFPVPFEVRAGSMIRKKSGVDTS